MTLYFNNIVKKTYSSIKKIFNKNPIYKFVKQEKEIKNLINNQKILIEKIKKLEHIENKYINYKYTINNAESYAMNIIEDAQSEALDAIYIIDDIDQDIKLFLQDIEFLKNDLQIGTLTIKDRINSIYNTISTHQNNLNKIKLKFKSKYKIK